MKAGFLYNELNHIHFNPLVYTLHLLYLHMHLIDLNEFPLPKKKKKKLTISTVVK